MSAADLPQRLTCGTDLMDLVAQVSDGTPPANALHQRTCEYCRDAIARLRAAVAQLVALASEEVRVPRGLSTRVLTQLRRERDAVVVAAGPAGTDTVSDTIVSQIARRAALGVEDVRLAFAVSTSRPDGVAVVVHLTARFGPALPELAEQVRERVLADARRLAGVPIVHLDVVVDDVVVDDDAPA